ncbi:hypothetical protein [Hyphomonas sp.]|uniref:hypothetical protein n=1 Tax=Hyphomonas sp. TaxID=87 RepID=UPI0025C581C6|nr:hypothetical protein [Hyphomonas sp.]
MSRTTVAHGLSLTGHPAILMPLASALAAVSDGRSPEMASTVLVAAGIVAASVSAFALLQVRRGKWADTDASVPAERSQLNLFLLPVLAVAAAWSVWSDQPEALSAGLSVAAGLVCLAVLASRWLKLSLHVSFAFFAASLFWPDLRLVGCGLAIGCLIGWSRIYLARHSLADVLTGALAGGLAGFAFQSLLTIP